MLELKDSLREIGSADVVIEAVYEQMSLKKQVFTEMDRWAARGAVLATNTSTLDINEIASVTSRPRDVIGLHFFGPAHVVKLLEVVREEKTSGAVIGRALSLGKRIGKVPLVVGVCDGFVGNRLLIARERQAGALLLEGALPDQVDRVAREFGLPMGPFELRDMAGGIELDYRHRQSTGAKDFLIDSLYERGRLGQRTGKGYYSYEGQSRDPRLDGEIVELIESASKHYGVTRRRIADAEIRDRLTLPMVNEATKLVEEGIVVRASDIDVVWQQGYNWPSWSGGPVYRAETAGWATVSDRLTTLEARLGPTFAPSSLLRKLAAENGKLLPVATAP